MVQEPVHCPTCDGIEIYRHGTTKSGSKRYVCRNPKCTRQTFILHYKNLGCTLSVKVQIEDMAMNGSGIRDTARVLKISPNTVIAELKKNKNL